MDYNNIPQEMRLYNQWIVWRFEDVNAHKPTKVLYSPLTGRHAKTNDPNTWATFDQACNSAASSNMYDGIGFVLTEGDPYAFIDLDDPFELLPTGKYKYENPQVVLDRQVKIYNEFKSYAEKSPSNKGLHIICKGVIPAGRKRGGIEVYTSGRFMTMTGNVYRDAPIVEENELLNVLWGQMGEGKVASIVYGISQPETMSDDQVLQTAQNAANSEKFTALLTGNWQQFYTSQSEADFAFVDILAFYSKNAEQIKRIFKASELGKRDKQTTIRGVDYISHMINRSFDRMLPPVDIEQLQNQLQEAIERKQAEDLATARSLQNDAQAAPVVQDEAQTLTPSNDIYSVPPGLVGEIARFIYAQSPRPVPEIALAGALGMVAGIVGRAYNVSGTGLNQYMLLLAPTGTGKEAISSGIDKLFAAVIRTVPAATDFIGPSEIASSQAIIKYMSKGPTSFVSLVGEFGLYLQQMASVNAAPHLMGLRRFLLDAYNKSGEGKVLRPSIYSDKDKNTTSVLSPAFSLLGESTPEKFYEGLHEGLISEGLLPRFTTIEYHGERPSLNPNHIQVQPGFELVDRLSTLCANCLMLNSQHKANQVQFTPEAKALFDQFDKHCDMNINSSDKEVRRHLWNRAHVKAMKLAALVAVGCNPYDPTISLDVATWATNIIVADVRNLLDRFNAGEIGVDNEETKQLSKVVGAIKEFVVSPWSDVAKYAGDGLSNLHSARIVPYSYLQRKLACVAVFRKDRAGPSVSIKRALTTLAERGDLQEVSRATLSRDYGTSARAFMISNLRAFEL